MRQHRALTAAMQHTLLAVESAAAWAGGQGAGTCLDTAC